MIWDWFEAYTWAISSGRIRAWRNRASAVDYPRAIKRWSERNACNGYCIVFTDEYGDSKRFTFSSIICIWMRLWNLDRNSGTHIHGKDMPTIRHHSNISWENTWGLMFKTCDRINNRHSTILICKGVCVYPNCRRPCGVYISYIYRSINGALIDIDAHEYNSKNTLVIVDQLR